MIKFSIIIPVYNREKFIRRSLQSALQQSYKNIEVICIDDASTDTSLNIITEGVEKDARIKIVRHQENKGTHMARKSGVEHASGDYILFLDCDDELALNACEILDNEISSADSDIIAFAHSDNGLIRCPNPELNADNLFENLVYDGHKTQSELWARCYKACAVKKAFSEMQDFYSIMAQDVIEVIIIAYQIKTYRSIPAVLHYYSRNTLGATYSTKSACSMKKYLLSEKNDIAALKDFFKDKTDGERIVQSVEKRLYEDMLDKIVNTVKLSDCKEVSEMLPEYFSPEVVAQVTIKINFSSPIKLFQIACYRLMKQVFYKLPNRIQVFFRKIKFSGK